MFQVLLGCCCECIAQNLMHGHFSTASLQNVQTCDITKLNVFVFVSVSVCETAQTDCADGSRKHRPGQRRPPAPDWRERDGREVSGNSSVFAPTAV